MLGLGNPGQYQDEFLEAFDHLLCRDLGWRRVTTMRREMPNAEYMDWLAFYAAEATENLPGKEQARLLAQIKERQAARRRR